MINQGRYIISGFIFFLVIFLAIVFIRTIIDTPHQPGEVIHRGQDTTKLSAIAMRGKELFQGTCAACHALDVDVTGPRLRGVLNREPYNGDTAKLINWITNTALLVNSNVYYKKLKEKFGGVVMPVFPIKNEDLKAIIAYLNSEQKQMIDEPMPIASR